MFGAILGANIGVLSWFYICFVKITFSGEKLFQIAYLMEVETMWVDVGALRSPKIGPERPNEQPRASQERPGAAQDGPGVSHEQPKSGQERPKSDQERPRAVRRQSWRHLGSFWDFSVWVFDTF